LVVVLVPTAALNVPSNRGLLAASAVPVPACQPRVVDGVHGHIAALLWAYPLLAPPPTTHNNKILWVSAVSTSGAPLIISAQRMIGSNPIGYPTRRTVAGGPGPSIINLPVAGCWRLELRWSGRSDTMDLEYLRNPG
jgi:hypothetical protein